MADEHKRLKLAREKSRNDYRDATDAARRHGWIVPTYLAHENGSRGFRKDQAEIYARAFKVRLEWLLTGKGEMASNSTVRLGGYVGAGAQVYPIDESHGLDDVEAPPDTTHNTRALMVRGDSMYPAYSDGDLIYYDAAQPPDDCLGIECVAELADGRRMLKVLTRGSRKGTYTLVSHNAVPIPDQRLVTCAPVTWVKRAQNRGPAPVRERSADLPILRATAKIQ